MKKTIKIIILIFCLLVFLIILFYKIYRNSKEYYITDNEYLYDVAVDYLKELDSNEINSEHDKNGYHFFIDYDGIAITEDNNNKYAYMWVLGESYYLEKEDVKLASGYSVFYKFTFNNNKIIKVETTRDCIEYVKSVKEMCPNKQIEKLVLNYDCKLSVKEQVNKYYLEH